MNRKQLMNTDTSSTLMRREGRSLPPLDAEEPVPNLFAGIWRHRWEMLAITIVFVICAVVYLRAVPPSYTVTATLTIDAPRQVTFEGVSPGTEGGGDGFNWTQVAIMQSPAVCGEAAKILAPNGTEEELHRLTNSLRGGLTPDVGHKDNVISLAYTDRNPDDAAAKVNAITAAYIQYVTKSRGASSQGMLDGLRAEQKKYGEQLTAQRNAEADFKKAHPDMQYTTAVNGGNIFVAQLAKLFDAKSLAIIDRISAISNLNAATVVKDDLPKLLEQAGNQGFPGSAATSAEIANCNRILTEAEARLSTYKGDLGPANQFVRRDNELANEMRAKVQVLQQQFGQEYLAYLEAQKLRADEKVKAIDEQIIDSEKNIEARAANSDAADYSKLENEVAATEKLLDALDQQIKGLDVVGVLGGVPNINVLTTGRAEDAAKTPQPSQVLLLTLVVGLACGTGFALVREKLDQRVRASEEIAALLGLPVIGAVPHMKRGLTPLARAQAVHWDPMSEVSEAYRAVRTAIHFGVPAGQARTIIVTSPTPGDGKSTLASNLAISMAQAGKRTLLLDADFRRPVQHKMFELKDESGLTTVLAGHEPLSKAIRRTVVEGLDLLPAGPLPLNPSELINGESFAAIIEEVMAKYDHIVIDSPPVIAVTDARILGAVCDISLLVLRAGKTTRRAAELASAGLHSVGARLLGVVVNDVPRGEEQYGYYGSYAYQSGNRGQPQIVDESGGSTNGHSAARRQRLPSPSGIDSM